MERSKGSRLEGWIESPNALRWRLGEYEAARLRTECPVTFPEASRPLHAKSCRQPPLFDHLVGVDSRKAIKSVHLFDKLWSHPHLCIASNGGRYGL